MATGIDLGLGIILERHASGIGSVGVVSLNCGVSTLLLLINGFLGGILGGVSVGGVAG
jgi:hypothetical protein